VQTVYVDRRDAELGFERGALCIRIPGEPPKTVPIRGVERLVVRTGARLSATLLAELWRRDAGVLVLAGRSREAAARFAGRPRKDLELRLRQYELVRDPDRRLAFAREIVAAKLAAHARLHRRLAEEGQGQRLRIQEAAERLAQLAEQAMTSKSLETLLGHEGTGAAVHFEAYATLFPPSLRFTGRNRRPPRDPVNACLSLAYTLLHFEAVRRLQMHGFDPMLGSLHAPASGRESLACDLVEPLRAHIDRWVYERFRKRELRRRDFRWSGEACYLEKGGRRRFYEAYEKIAPVLARLLARMCRNLARELRARVPPAVVLEEDEEER